MSEFYSCLPMKSRFNIINEYEANGSKKVSIRDAALRNEGNGTFRGNRLILQATYDKYGNLYELETFEIFSGKWYEGLRKLDG